MVRRMGFESQGGPTTPYALNVRTNDSILGRDRGGSRPGLNKGVEGGLPGPVRMMHTLRYVQENHVKSRLVASAGGNLYLEGDAGEMILKHTTPQISLYNNVMATEFSGKLYIANTGRGVAGDWISGIVGGYGCPPHPNGHSRVCYHATPAELLANPEAVARLTYDGPPLVYDPIADTLADLTATAGTVPEGCAIIAVHAGRLVLAGAATDPQQWYMSKVLDPQDWDYASTSPGAAVSATTSGAAAIGAPITAFCPHTDLCAFFGCRTSLWILRGDPVTGVLDVVSREIGIIDKNAWCTTADGWMVFLSADGVYAVPAQCGARDVEPISREKLPEELLNVDPNKYDIELQYDVREKGVHLFMSSRDTVEFPSQHWWIDWRSKDKSFWQVSMSTDFDPTATVHRRDITGDQSTVWLGCRDGYIRRTDRNAEDDDGEPFDTSIFIGPIQLSEPGGQGFFSSLAAKLASNSNNVAWSLHIGDTIEQAYEAPAVASGKFTASSSSNLLKHRLRYLAGSAFIKLSAATAGQTWAIEQVVVESQGVACVGGCK
jgi:hypothetical protein